MDPRDLVIAGGVFHAALVVFHLFFWKLFRWKTELAKLTSLNRAVMQVLNLCLTFAFVVFAYLSWVHTDELVSTDMGRALLLLLALFWYSRAAQQIIFFGLRKGLSWAFLAYFLAGGSLYLAAWL